jgi:hypothetical protein
MSLTTSSARTASAGDADGHALAYAYFEDQAGPRAAAHRLTRDEARLAASAYPRLSDFGALLVMCHSGMVARPGGEFHGS